MASNGNDYTRVLEHARGTMTDEERAQYEAQETANYEEWVVQQGRENRCAVHRVPGYVIPESGCPGCRAGAW